jgi:ABC-2 type transport system ATP-binding protein
MVRTGAGAQAAAVLERAGAAVTVPSPGLLAVSGLASDRVVRVLGESGVPFSEVAAHRASLEEAYLSLTADAVEFRAAAAAGDEGR